MAPCEPLSSGRAWYPTPHTTTATAISTCFISLSHPRDLVRAILGELNARTQSSFATLTAGDAPSHRGSALQRFWDWAILPANLPYWRLHFELNILAIQNPAEYGRYRQDRAAQWQMLALQSLSGPQRSEPTAAPVVTLAIAVFDGLMLELIGGLRPAAPHARPRSLHFSGFEASLNATSFEKIRAGALETVRNREHGKVGRRPLRSHTRAQVTFNNSSARASFPTLIETSSTVTSPAREGTDSRSGRASVRRSVANRRRARSLQT